MNGVISAYLAKDGFTGPETIFEGDKGFCKATSNEYDLGKLTENLGPGRGEYKLLTNSFKIHATCRHIHSSLDAAIAIVNENALNAGDITSIDIRLYDAGMDLLERKAVKPRYGFEAMFSIPFCVATAVIHGSVGLEAFTDERLRDGEIEKLMPRVHLHRDKALNKDYPREWPAIVKITTGSGAFERRVDYPKGDSENPLSLDELVAKFRGMVSGIIPDARAEALIQRMLDIENVRIAKFFSS